MNRRLPILALALAGLLAAPSIVAAAEPTLAATVIPGQEIDLAGSGFPANSDVQLAIQRNGTDDGSQALRTDASGAFTARIDAGPGHGGVYVMTATSGSASATIEALAVETAGGLGSTPPPTDTASAVDGGSSSDVGQLAVLILVAAGSLSVALPANRRRARGGAASVAGK